METQNGLLGEYGDVELGGIDRYKIVYIGFLIPGAAVRY